MALSDWMVLSGVLTHGGRIGEWELGTVGT